MNSKNTFRLLAIAASSFAAGSLTGTPATGADWPSYRGPQGNGQSSESLTNVSFGESGPAQIWKTETPLGFSSFAVSEGKAVTLVAEDVDGNPMEVCLALDAATGEKLWESQLWLSDYKAGGGNAGEKGNDGGDGPRSTPTIDGDSVYVLDAHLRLYALNLSDGEIQWKVDLERDYSAENIRWMSAASPVVSGDHIFVAGGGKNQSLLCLNKSDGSLKWKSESDAITHATPVVAEVAGVEQVIYFTQSGLVSVRPEDGSVLWRYDFKYNVSTAASPVVWQDIVYCSAGYGVGGGAVKVSKDGNGLKAEEIYRKEQDLVNHWSTPVVYDGHMYGMFSFKEYGKGPLACVDIATGEMKWKQGGFGPGNVIVSEDGKLVVLSDRGELVIAAADQKSYKEIARADVLDGKCWSTPALAGGKVYVRSTEEGACFNLSSGVALNR